MEKLDLYLDHVDGKSPKHDGIPEEDDEYDYENEILIESKAR